MSEQYFRSLVDASTAIIWTTDRSGRSSYLSRPWYEFTGEQPEADHGMRWIDSIHADDQDQASQQFFHSCETSSPFRAVYRLRHVSGQYRWVVASGMPLFDEAGVGIGLVGTVVDVHDEREAKRTQEALADDLAVINQRQNEFLVTLAHELRNPLAPIRNGLEVIKMLGADNERQRSIHQMMDRQVHHLTHLVDDLLDIARITEGKINLKKQRVLVKDAFTDAVEISMPLIEKNQHKLVVEVPDPNLVIDADPHRITQVISNILNNAAKYTPPGGKIVVASHAERTDAVITVTDNGIGLAPEHIARVFGMFAQIQAEVDRAQGGLGVGLHLVKRLVDLHGGEVSVVSQGLGLGCTFSIRLPLVRPEHGSGKPGKKSQSGNASVLRILIVDDNVDNAEMLSMLMDYHGHTSRIATTGREALEIANTTPLDVVFLDIGLPDMSGYEVVGEMRKIAGLDKTRFVALTGRGAQHDKLSATAAGFDHHVTKPASLDRLIAILGE